MAIHASQQILASTNSELNYEEMQAMVIPEGLEPPTYRLGICRSILMSYGTTSLLCPNL